MIVFMQQIEKCIIDSYNLCITCEQLAHSCVLLVYSFLCVLFLLYLSLQWLLLFVLCELDRLGVTVDISNGTIM